MAGNKSVWTAENVHEIIFKPRFMPKLALLSPSGVEHTAHMGTSDAGCTSRVLAEAMDVYQAWIYGQGMEITVPNVEF